MEIIERPQRFTAVEQRDCTFQDIFGSLSRSQRPGLNKGRRQCNDAPVADVFQGIGHIVIGTEDGLLQGEKKLRVLIRILGIAFGEHFRLFQSLVIAAIGKIEQKHLPAQLQIVRIVGQSPLEIADGVFDIAVIQGKIAGEIVTQHRLGRRSDFLWQVDDAVADQRRGIGLLIRGTRV